MIFENKRKKRRAIKRCNTQDNFDTNSYCLGIPSYNSLFDANLSNYFRRIKVQNALAKNLFIDRKGRIINSEKNIRIVKLIEKVVKETCENDTYFRNNEKKQSRIGRRKIKNMAKEKKKRDKTKRLIKLKRQKKRENSIEKL